MSAPTPTQLCFDESHGHRYGAPTCTNVRLLIHNFREVVEDVRGAGSSQDFLLFLDAPRHLWAAKYDLIDQTPSPFEINVMRQGYEVEALAKEYLEKNILKPDENLILQKTFTDGQFNIRTDILIHKPALDSYDLYEVKSGTSIKKENIYDVTYQFLIVNKHINIDRPFILHLNSEYIRYSNLNLAELFVAEDVTEMVLKLKDEVDKLRDIALETVHKPSHEDIQPCFNPKCCSCPDICHPRLPEYSIFDIPRLSAKKKTELICLGIVDIKDIPKSFSLNSKQRQIVDVAQSNQALTNKEAIQKEFQHFTFPLYFLDYETYLSAIPMYDGYKPQQQMVFQYSLHKMESLNGDIRHTDHLSVTKDDPSKSLIKQLRDDIGDTGTVFVWNKPFEMTRNKELAIIHPEYAAFLEDLNDRIYDLGDFINFGFYLHPKFKGSWSIKNVLPVMVPELSYEGMEIGKGDMAMMAWFELINDKLSTDDAEKTKTALLEYCKLDTFAMVKIWEKLFELGN
jgi:hypothetical protein